MKNLYINGPTFEIGGINVGFWGGMNKSDICASMSNVYSLHWESNVTLCEELINKKVYSLYIMFKTIFLFFIFAKVIYLILDVINYVFWYYFSSVFLLKKIQSTCPNILQHHANLYSSVYKRLDSDLTLQSQKDMVLN